MTTATDFRHVVLETGAQASLEKGKRELPLLSCVALRIALLQACSLLWFSCTEQNALGLRVVRGQHCCGAVLLLWGCAAAVGLCCCCGAVLLLCCSPSQAALQLQSVIQWGLHREDEVGELASMFIVAL